jgi:hypothetical protein
MGFGCASAPGPKEQKFFGSFFQKRTASFSLHLNLYGLAFMLMFRA